MVTIVVSAIIGVILFCYTQTTNQFFIKIVEAFNIPAASQPILSGSLAMLIFSDLGAYLSNVAVRSTCKFLFGDPDFYVTKKRAIKLEQQFREQGNEHITQQQIIEVVDFCRKNLRRQPSSELAAKHEDWKKTLESLLYDADMEHFLDQQKALRLKRIEIRKKREAFLAYSSVAQLDELITTPPTITSPITRDPLPPTSPTYLTQFESKATNTSLVIKSDEDPSSSSGSRHSSMSQQPNTAATQLTQQELNRFRHHHLKRKKYTVPPSEEQLLHHYECHLQHKELKATRSIYPFDAANAVIFDSTSSLPSYSRRNSRADSLGEERLTFAELPVSDDTALINPPCIELQQPTPVTSKIYPS